MTEGMPSVTARNPLRYALAAAAVVVAPVLLPAVAVAQEPAGRTVVGELVQAWPEAEHAADAGTAADSEQPLTWVETADGDAVRLPSEDVTGLPVGATVEVTVGDEVVDEATDDGLDPALELLDSKVVTGPVTRRAPARAITNAVTVALVAPAGAKPDATTVAEVVDAVNGEAARFWAGQSDGAISLGVTKSHGWTTTVAGCEDPGEMWLQAAAEVGFTPGPGKHLLLYVSSAAADCAYGLAQVGSTPSSGGRVYVTDVLPSLIAHEIGHNFGLGHSSALYCAHGAEIGGCDTAAYRDHYDVMGASWEQIGSLNALQADRLGVLPDDAVRTVRASDAGAEVTLAPLSGDGIRAVRLVDARGREYWLELRTATGQDSWLGDRDNRFHLEAGVLVRRSGQWPHASLLLDPTPRAGRDGDFQAALPAGKTVTLGGGAFAVTVGGGTAAGATVTVSTVGTEAAAEAESAPGTGTEPTPETPETPEAPEAPDSPQAPDSPDIPETLPAGDVPAAPTTPADEPESAVVGGTATGTPVDVATAPVAAAPAQPAVAEASSVREFVVPAAGAALGCSAFVLVRRLIRVRTPR